MPRRLIVCVIACVVLWAVVVYAVARCIPPGYGGWLGFLGTMTLFYPTADIELRKWLHGRKPPGGDGQTRQGAPVPPRRRAVVSFQGMQDYVDRLGGEAISIFSVWHAAAFLTGLTLIALGFATGLS